MVKIFGMVYLTAINDNLNRGKPSKQQANVISYIENLLAYKKESHQREILTHVGVLQHASKVVLTGRTSLLRCITNS